MSPAARVAALRVCAISALACVELIIGGVAYGELHWSQVATQALQLPVYATMLHLMRRAIREQVAQRTGRHRGQAGGRPVNPSR